MKNEELNIHPIFKDILGNQLSVGTKQADVGNNMNWDNSALIMPTLKPEQEPVVRALMYIYDDACNDNDLAKEIVLELIEYLNKIG